MKKIILLLALLALLLLPNALAVHKQGHLKLLAVSELSNGTQKGGIAELYLEIKEGSGRVFLETFPLTKTDTQMSTRFAKTIACDFVDIECSNYDFFYTITADSPIIAGPSAGSPISALTVAMLLDIDINEKVAATGTINSGGLVGPVGGLKAKLEAGSKSGLKKILIPMGESAGDGNETVNLTALSGQLGISIVEVSSIEDVVYEFTGYKKKKQAVSLNINKGYQSRMKMLSLELCNRSIELMEEFGAVNSTLNFSPAMGEALNLTEKGQESFARQEYYSSASYCFGANVQLSTLILQSRNLSADEIRLYAKNISRASESFGIEIESRQKRTIADLEAYAMVKERLEESEEISERSIALLNDTNSTSLAVRNIAYAFERYNSALSWSKFFGSDGRLFNINKELLKKACQSKLSEVEERIQYVEMYITLSQEHVRKQLNDAYDDLSNGNYELCLFEASKAKAEIDTILNVFGVGLEHFSNLLERKLSIVKDNLAVQSQKGVFSIVGYSYYEYANSLKDSNTMMGLIYSEYALELGNLDIYFKEQNKESGKMPIRREEEKSKDYGKLAAFATGIALGFTVSLLFFFRRKKGKAKVE